MEYNLHDISKTFNNSAFEEFSRNLDLKKILYDMNKKISEGEIVSVAARDAANNLIEKVENSNVLSAYIDREEILKYINDKYPNVPKLIHLDIPNTPLYISFSQSAKFEVNNNMTPVLEIYASKKMIPNYDRIDPEKLTDYFRYYFRQEIDEKQLTRHIYDMILQNCENRLKGYLYGLPSEIKKMKESSPIKIPQEYIYAINVARNNLRKLGRYNDIYITTEPYTLAHTIMYKTKIDPPIFLNIDEISKRISGINLDQKDLNALMTVIIGHEAAHSGSSAYIINNIYDKLQNSTMRENLKQFLYAAASQMEELRCDMGGIKTLFNSIGTNNFNDNLKQAFKNIGKIPEGSPIPKFSERSHPSTQVRLKTMDSLYSLYTTKKNMCNALLKGRNIVTLDTPGKRFATGASIATMAGAGMAAMAAANESYDYLLESRSYSDSELFDIVYKIDNMLATDYNNKIMILKTLNQQDLINFEQGISNDSKRILMEIKNNTSINDVLCYMLSLAQLFVTREDYILENEVVKNTAYAIICSKESKVLETELLEFYKNVKDKVKDVKNQITDQRILDKIQKIDALDIDMSSNSILRSLTSSNNIKIMLAVGAGSVAIYYLIKYWKRIKEKVSNMFNKKETENK